jgi:diguanylate cyclase (GGDEF)-like protein
VGKSAVERQMQHRLQMLQKQISSAEARLLDLNVAIETASSQDGLRTLTRTLTENQRLRDANQRAGEEAISAFAALEDAVKASRTDQLTGVLNRLALWDRLGHEIERAKRSTTYVAVYFLDLDSFKDVNDTLGHAVGDSLLQHVANHLVNTFRASDTVCRLGGDEFAVVFPAPRVEDVEIMTQKLKTALTSPLILDGKNVSYSVSAGCSVYPTDSTTPSGLLQMADESMYQQKRFRAANLK